MTKKGPWGRPDISPELEAEIIEENRKKREEKLNLEKQMIDEAGMHWCGPDEDVIEYLEYILDKNGK